MHLSESPPSTVRAAPPSLRAGVQRHTGIDGIRVIATLMVVLIHISGKGAASGITTQHWWASNFYESISRGAVPLFFMVTGALLLSREHTVASTWKRIWRMLVPLFAWSVVFLIWGNGYRAAEPGWIQAIISRPAAGHLWYLYSLIPAYVFLPVLSAFFLQAKPRMRWFVLGGWFAAGSIIPTVNYLYQAPIIGFDREFFYIYPGYMLLGALLWSRKEFTRSQLILGALLFALGVAATGIGTYVSTLGKPGLNETLYQYYSATVVIAAAGAFVCIAALFDRLGRASGFVAGFVAVFGKASFGIYLVHPLFIWMLEMRGYDYKFTNPWIAIPALMVVVVAASWAVTEVLRRIPVVRMTVPG